jgi:hypothetical protein
VPCRQLTFFQFAFVRYVSAATAIGCLGLNACADVHGLRRERSTRHHGNKPSGAWGCRLPRQACAHSIPGGMLLTGRRMGLAYLTAGDRRERRRRELCCVLDSFSPSSPGLCLHYPSRRYQPAGLCALISFIEEVRPRAPLTRWIPYLSTASSASLPKRAPRRACEVLRVRRPASAHPTNLTPIHLPRRPSSQRIVRHCN